MYKLKGFNQIKVEEERREKRQKIEDGNVRKLDRGLKKLA